MSIKISLNDLTDREKETIVSTLQFTKKETEYNKFEGMRPVRPYDITEDESTREAVIYLPFYWALKNIKKCKMPKKDKYPLSGVTFTGTLRPNQKEVQKEAIQSLNKTGTCILSLYTGCGKTITGINLACKIKLKTLIIVHRLVLINQWKDSIYKVCDNAKIQILGTKSEFDDECNFFIMNAINVTKKHHGFFDKIGTLIVDELHVMGTDKLSQSFFYVEPKYCIGLSATPYRPDGMDDLLNVYFGEHRIVRKLLRNHYVFRVDSGFKPEHRMGANGKLDWNSVLESQTGSIERNQIIIDIVRYFKDRNFLILSKRISQVEYLVKKLEEVGESVTSLVGVKKHFNYDSRVLIATVQKAGVGFDHPKLDSLIIASDVEEYFIQYLGRVFRTEDGFPYIFDILDDFPTLKRHYYTRRQVYLEHGGIIKKFNSREVEKIGYTDFNSTFNYL